MNRLEKQLKALANKRRLAIVKFLESKNEATVGQVADHIHLSFKATSRHLAVLRSAELLDKDQRSKEVYYFLLQPKESLTKIILSLL